MYNDVVNFIKAQFNSKDFIPLHSPSFIGNEKVYVLESIDSTYVSSVGKYVDLFEEKIKKYTGAKHAIATVNGTSALHMALLLVGVKKNDLVITQSLSFIATCNAISYLSAEPVFVDIDKDTLGMSPKSLKCFLEKHTLQSNGECIHKDSGRRISACVPMHTFGHPVKIDLIAEICSTYNVALVEDAAESIGSFYRGVHTGNYGMVGVFSFNGNKTVTCGGGGMIITNNDQIAKKAKHLTTQAKMPHRWEFVHDNIGYNYRLPNINAALACAQMENIEKFINAKRNLAYSYQSFFNNTPFKFIKESDGARANYWLNAILVNNYIERNSMLAFLNDSGVMARPCWMPMHKLKMFENCYRISMDNTEWISERLINIPSSYSELFAEGK
jgi:aminotransferase in exopolysaccharide biosynthesis